MKQFDYLVLGSGIAGLSYALKVAPHGRVAIVTKKDRAESNTNYAQGGIAAVTSKEDSFELHVRDTLQAGAGLCQERAVRTIIEEGPARIAELIELGMQFSEREIQLSHGAREIDLVTSQKLGYVGDHRCLGVYVFDKKTGQVETFAAPVTLMATGGCGKVYL